MNSNYVLRDGRTVHISNVTIICGENYTGKLTALRELHDDIKPAVTANDYSNTFYIDLSDMDSPVVNGFPEEGNYSQIYKSNKILGTKRDIINNPNLTKGMRLCYNMINIISVLEYANSGSCVFIVQPENGLYDTNIAYLVDLITYLSVKGVRFFILTYSEAVIRRFLVNVRRNVIKCDDVTINLFIPVDNIFKIPLQTNGSIYDKDDDGKKYVWSDLYFNQENEDLDILIFNDSTGFLLHE